MREAEIGEVRLAQAKPAISLAFAVCGECDADDVGELPADHEGLRSNDRSHECQAADRAREPVLSRHDRQHQIHRRLHEEHACLQLRDEGVRPGRRLQRQGDDPQDPHRRHHDSKSYANRLNDSRFLALAKTFNFAADGEAATQKTDAQQGVVDRYIRQEIETSAGQDDEGVRLALYFQREAPNVKSAYGLLGDTALWTVVKTIFGFPDAMASADIDKQAAAVEKRLNLSDLQDPAKLEKLITQFAATWDATQNTTTDPILALFDTTSTSGANVDFDLAMTLTNLKHGGT